MTAYEEFGIPKDTEFIILTRSKEVTDFVESSKFAKYCYVIMYDFSPGYNPALALNLGVRTAKYNDIIVTSPEVIPLTNVLKQLESFRGQNVICQVFDESSPKHISISLVNSGFRSADPGMYFLGMFQRSDLEKINGWDEDFMKGYAWEDSDFGRRWNRAGLRFVMRDDIQAVHQFHERPETIPGGYSTNKLKYDYNNDNLVIRCKNGLSKE
jgi:hypothetical protein